MDERGLERLTVGFFYIAPLEAGDFPSSIQPNTSAPSCCCGLARRSQGMRDWECQGGPDSPSAGEWEYLCKCSGDNGVQTQSIRQRKKIAKRKKIKGNAWALVLMLNQSFVTRLSPHLSVVDHVQGEKRRMASWHSFSRQRVRRNLKERSETGCRTGQTDKLRKEREKLKKGGWGCVWVSVFEENRSTCLSPHSSTFL